MQGRDEEYIQPINLEGTLNQLRSLLLVPGKTKGEGDFYLFIFVGVGCLHPK